MNESAPLPPLENELRFAPAGLDLGADLPGAADRGELFAVFQPQWDVRSSRMVAVEALCRWRHPEFGVISPSVFIPAAESTGAIHAIGDFMINEACDFAASVQRRGIELDVSINVSVMQLTSARACERILARVAELGLDATRITVEVTESMEISDLDEVLRCLGTLRAQGVGISIDDFGVGNSSREQVIRLPTTEIKIDRSLVQRPVDEARVLVREVVELAAERGLRVVAEGVETDEQLAMVRSEGCDRVQGFLLGHPAHRSAIEAMLLD